VLEMTDRKKYVLNHILVAYLSLPVCMIIVWPIVIGVPIFYALLWALPMYAVICLMSPVAFISILLGMVFGAVSWKLHRYIPPLNIRSSLALLFVIIAAASLVATHSGLALQGGTFDF